MKKIFSTIILLLLVIILLTGIIILGTYIFFEFSGKESDSVIYEVGKAITEKIDEKEKLNTNLNYDSDIDIDIDSSDILNQQNKQMSDSINNEQNINTFFYKQLNTNQKIIYDGLRENKQFLKKGNYVINFKDKFSKTLQQENGSDILGDDYQAAIEAVIYDKPDLFYLDIKKMYLNMESKTKFFKTTYNVYIAPSNENNYLLDEFKSEEQIDSSIVQIEKIKNKIINNLNGTDYQNILYIHDYLIDNIEYDTTYEKEGCHSIYGAFVNNECVCEGYAKAFKYLANSAGYECELMTGKATNSKGETENHLWNCIKINDKWYEVDPTWDDPIVIGGNRRATNEMKYRYFLKGTSTFNKDHMLEYQFTEKGRSFSYPDISQSDY